MLKPVPLFGSGVFGKSAVVTRQRRLNCYYELRPDGDKAKVVIYGTPGLALKYTLASPGNTPTRAIMGVADTSLYAVVGNQFQSLSPAGMPVNTATIGTSSGLCSLAANPAGSQICMVDGSQGYVYVAATGLINFLPTGSWFVPGAKTLTNVGGYFVSEYPGTAEFGVSNINDATTGSSLSFGTAAAYPDVLLAVDNLAGNLLLFCSGHMEFWQPIGTPPPSQPFAPIQSATNQWGLGAVFSRSQVDDSLIVLMKSRQGTRRIVQIRGYVATPISEEIDAVINTPGFIYTDAVSMTFQVDKHAFYRITFPTMGRTFDFDCSTGIWNEAQTGLTPNYAARHQGNLSTSFAGETLVTDYANSNIYTLDPTAFTDNGVTILREIITRHTVRGFNRFRVPRLYLDMETGVGLSTGAIQDTDPQLGIEVSKDNGRSWLPQRLVSVGKLGHYLQRVNARRFGQARVFTWRFRYTAATKFVITDGAITVKGRMAA